MLSVPRKYGSTPSYREVAYEVLYQQKGASLPVREIVAQAIKLGMLDRKKTPDTAWNTMAAKLNSDARFTRTDQNTFGLTAFSEGRYEGHYRTFLEEAKEDRRRAAVEAGELESGRKSPGPQKRSSGDAARVKEMTALAQTETCTREWGAHDAQILRVQGLVKELFGFHTELRALALLRSGKFTQCRELLMNE